MTLASIRNRLEREGYTQYAERLAAVGGFGWVHGFLYSKKRPEPLPRPSRVWSGLSPAVDPILRPILPTDEVVGFVDRLAKKPPHEQFLLARVWADDRVAGERALSRSISTPKWKQPMMKGTDSDRALWQLFVLLESLWQFSIEHGLSRVTVGHHLQQCSGPFERIDPKTAALVFSLYGNLLHSDSDPGTDRLSMKPWE